MINSRVRSKLIFVYDIFVGSKLTFFDDIFVRSKLTFFDDVFGMIFLIVVWLRPRSLNLVAELMNLSPLLVHLIFGTISITLRFVTSEYDNGMDMDRLLLVGGLHKRLGFNFNNSLLVFVSVFLSLPNSLQHHHF